MRVSAEHFSIANFLAQCPYILRSVLLCRHMIHGICLGSEAKLAFGATGCTPLYVLLGKAENEA